MSAEPKLSPYALPLKSRAEVAERTLEFRFDMPEGLSFKAGQFMDLTLKDPPETDAEGNTRGFSINSAPGESELFFTTRLRDTAWKRVLRSMPLGTRIELEGPFGDFTLQHSAKRPAILLAGGIGITPFRSIVRWATRQKLQHRIFLFYGNRRPEDAPFLEELSGLARDNARLSVIPVMSCMADSHATWTGETGYITHALIARYVERDAAEKGVQGSPIYYMAGPAPMVAALRSTLTEAGVDEDDLRTEEFSGY